MRSEVFLLQILQGGRGYLKGGIQRLVEVIEGVELGQIGSLVV